MAPTVSIKDTWLGTVDAALWFTPLPEVGGSARGVDMALGKGSGLIGFAEEIGAHSWFTWHEAGLISAPIDSLRFADQFYEAASSARSIRFNLEGVDISASLSMETALATSRTPLLQPAIEGNKLVTEWELRQVLGNESLFEKTTFHWGGNVTFTTQDAVELGLRYSGF
jgi:hypothetical protein